MKTIEEVNGQKVWAVDRLGCTGCMFREDMICPDLLDIGLCNSFERLDKRDVIFLPYSEEEEEEKTFTREEVENLIVKAIEWGYNKCENNSSSWKPYDWIDANL